LSGVSFEAAQSVMTASNYATQAQVHLLGDPYQGTPRLGS
jgi:hypothetical protein